MEVADYSEDDASELEGSQDALLATSEALNPFPEKLNVLSRENKRAGQFVADSLVSSVGSLVFSSINRSDCRYCYCGHKNELTKCDDVEK